MYDEGIGTKIDNQKAFELYQNAANLANDVNLASIYEKGDGITKDIDKKQFIWYEKSVKQGNQE
ncbi:hypothetical protein RirG_014440 [Rhizophagus irregularis DAOM 197198w]|uniref:Beta-lactamase n=1 Tax=Rhizophagus irregularis (strain DAOM 197198w) TaxID=1432141 RepID=A0A015K9M1_RHIIW|nr:hypothetical protein RirG_014440 [Rhizophagus irregularis DAOM 197198w]